MAEQAEMARHPDIVELRKRYDVASSSPVAEAVAGLTLLGAAFLAASPWIVGFSGLTAIAITDLIAGGALAALVFTLTAAYGRFHGLTWVVVAIGAWTIVAPWAMAGAMDVTRTIWSNCFAGGAIVLLGLTMLVAGFFRTHRLVSAKRGG